jgi:SprT protein
MDAPIEIIEARALQIPQRLREEVIAKVDETIRLARRVHRRHFDMPRVSYAVRGRAAGKASFGEWEVMFNATLLQENAQEMVKDVVIHEVAHLVTRAMHGREVASHGEEWKLVMKSLGAEPNRTHSFDVANAAVGRLVFKWACVCKQTVFSEAKHSKLIGGKASVRCRKCKQTLRYCSERRVDGVWERVGSSPQGQLAELGRRGGVPQQAGRALGAGFEGVSQGAGLSPPFGGELPPWFGPPSWEKQASKPQKAQPLVAVTPGFTDTPPFGGGLPPWYRAGKV